MNFEAWQAQQKAQKDEERRRKNQATEALQNYRSAGLSEEDTKLAALRDEERKRKTEAAQQLQNYRGGGLSEEDTKLAALKEDERRKKQEAEEQLQNYRGGISEEDTKLAALKEEERRKKQEAEAQLHGFALQGSSHDSADVASNVQQRASAVIVAGAVSAASQKFSGGAEENQPVLAQTPSTTTASATQATPPSPMKSSVCFVFGLISSNENSVVDGYLATTDRIVESTVGTDRKKDLSFEYPVVQSIATDATYRDPSGSMAMTRRLVTVSVSYVAPNDDTSQNIKSRIVESIKSAVAAGAFQKK